VTTVVSPKEHENGKTQTPKSLVRFNEWGREAQFEAFLAWLPPELHNAPGVQWSQFPAEVMGYCVRTISTSPDASILAMAVASAQGAMTNRTYLAFAGCLNRLFRALRTTGKMEHLSDLHHEQVWQEFVENTKRTNWRKELIAYRSVVTRYFPSYLQRLAPSDRLRMQAYTLPPMPYDVLRSHFPSSRLTKAAQTKRKAQSDILVPLYPVLRQLVCLRKQLAARTFATIRDACHKVEAGEATLPFHFQHTDTIPMVNRTARTISEVELQGKEVTMSFVMWDKPTWVDYHKDRFSYDVLNDARMSKDSYAPELNRFFVQYEGKPQDLLWFGDLVEQRLLQALKDEAPQDAAYQQRQQLARALGFPSGCHGDRPGVLNSGDRWFAVHHSPGDFIFEPESLYRGILLGSAFTMIARSNGSRMSELLQVSANKERRITRTETVMILGDTGLPVLGDDGKPQTKQIKIYLQHLLPKGSKTEEERQLFPLSKECMRLLGEIKAMLEEVHGEVPVVHPSRTSAKYEHLKPERYLFQWAASPDGRVGILSVNEAQVLLRFVLHGLELYTIQGEPIRVSVHLLRHVMATHARQYRHVPPEVIAHFFLHHRLKALTGRDPSPSEWYDYYTEMTEKQRLAVISADLDEQEEMDRALLQRMLSLGDLEQKNADLQAVYDEWHTLHSTALGNCGCPGLCPRGNDRALCLGCGYHVEDPDKLGVALSWRASYTRQAELFDAQGNAVDARQARIKVQQLDDMINVMQMQIREEAAGHYIPVFKVLPSPYRKIEESHEEKH
jgi:hypothetical protein